MPRLLSCSLAAMLVMVSLISVSTNPAVVDAQSTSKPQCAPLHALYKSWVAPCTNNGTAVPNADSDPLWLPCICLPGFFPLAQASENCMLAGSTETHMITVANLNSLCAAHVGYVDASKQTPDPKLAPALASATSIAAAIPSETNAPSSGGSGGSSTSASSRVDVSLLVKVSTALTASVVLATTLVL